MERAASSWAPAMDYAGASIFRMGPAHWRVRAPGPTMNPNRVLEMEIVMTFSRSKSDLESSIRENKTITVSQSGTPLVL